MSHLSRPRALRVLSGGVLAALTLGLTAGVASPASAVTTYTATYDNLAAITIPDNASADPYPSTITVPSGGGVTSIGDVSVTLHGLSHTYVGDLDVELVSPAGTSVFLLCGQPVNGSNEADAVEATFTTDGTGTQECSAPSYDPLDLVDLAHEDPTGQWDLYVDDLSDGDTGGIAGGWSLAFNQSAPFALAGQPQDTSSVVNQKATFTASASGAPTPMVQWQVSRDGGTTWTDLSDSQATRSTYTTPWLTMADDGARYRARFTDPTDPTQTGTTSAATLRVFDKPGAPRSVAATQSGERQLTVTWTDPASNGNDPITAYVVTATAGASTVSTTVGAGARSAVLDVPSAGPTYSLSVAARNAAGDGTPGTGSVPTRPTVIITKLTAPVRSYGNTITVQGTGGAGEAYTLERSVGGGAWTTVYRNHLSSTGTYTAFDKAINNASYRVRGENGLASAPVAVSVKQAMTMAAKRVSTRKYTFYGTVSPVKALTAVKVYYRKSSGAYGYLGATKTTSTGKWSYTKKFTASKTMVFKAVVSATPLNASTYKTLRVAVR